MPSKGEKQENEACSVPEELRGRDKVEQLGALLEAELRETVAKALHNTQEKRR